MSDIKIRTFKIKATDTTGEAVRAKAFHNGRLVRTATVPWDYSRSAMEMHTEAAKKVIGVAVNWTGAYTTTGYVFKIAK